MYTLEKVLIMKKDAVTQINFMDEAMKVSRYPRKICGGLSHEVTLRFLKTNRAPVSGLFSRGR